MKKPTYFRRICLVFVGAVSLLTGCIVGEREPKSSGSLVKEPTNPGGILITTDQNAGDAARNYQKNYDNPSSSVYVDKKKLVEFIESCPECDGVRIYRTINNNVKVEEKKEIIGIVLVGVKDKKDVIEKSVLTSYDRCPENCDLESIFYFKK